MWVQMKSKLDFLPHTTARIILGKNLSIATCGSQMHRRDRPYDRTMSYISNYIFFEGQVSKSTTIESVISQQEKLGTQNNKP